MTGKQVVSEIFVPVKLALENVQKKKNMQRKLKNLFIIEFYIL